MDEATRKYLSEITKAGQKKRVQRGLPVSHVPIGYRVVNGLIGLDPETAPKIREAFAMKENGKTLHDIRYFLTKEVAYALSDVCAGVCVGAFAF